MSRNVRALYRVVSGLLIAVFLFSAFMTGTYALGWNYFRDHKTNEAFGRPIYAAVTLEKTGKGIDGEITSEIIPGAEFYLYKVGDGGDLQIGERFVTDKNGQIQVYGLHPGVYYFEETHPGYSYVYDRDENGGVVVRYEFTLTGDELVNPSVKITAYNRRVTGALIIAKAVRNEDGAPLTSEQRDMEFSFIVTFSDGGAYTYKIDGEGEALSVESGGLIALKNGQTAVFADIPLGTQYTVVETPVADYVIQSDNHQGNITGDERIAAFTNTLRTNPEPPDNLGSLKIVKAVTGEMSYNEIGRLFHFTLEVDGREPEVFTLKAGESKQFDNLPIGAAYVIREIDARPDGYALTSVTNGAGTLTAEEITSVFTNTYVDRVVILVEGEKTWDLNGYKPTLPESVTINLKDGGLVVDTATVIPDKDGKWTYAFEAPKYNKEGEEIQYTAEEWAINQWEAQVDGLNIKNVYIPPVVTPRPPPIVQPPDSETYPPLPPPGSELPESTPTPSQPPDGADETLTPPPSPIEPPPSDQSPPVPTTPGQKGPTTGDEANFAFWSILMILSMLGLISTFVWKTKFK